MTDDQRNLKTKRWVRNPAFIADIAAAVERDWLLMTEKLALAYADLPKS